MYTICMLKIPKCNKRNQRISEINNILKNDPLRSSWWRDVIGDDYYIETFKILRDNFPGVELIYNEYNEMLPCKADRISKIIDSLNTLLAKINNNSNGYLLLEMELISFI